MDSLESENSKPNKNEEQYGYSNYPPKSHFEIKGKDVFCDSRDFKITIDNEEFNLKLELGNKIFDQFDEILETIAKTSRL